PLFFFSSRRRHTRFSRDWSSDVCSSDLIITMRMPGMTMFRMPIFTWNILITSLLVLMAFPVLAAALFGLAFDRVLGGQIYNPERSEERRVGKEGRSGGAPHPALRDARRG